MRVVWLNRCASLQGGGEQAISSAVQRLSRDYQMDAVLLYELGSKVDRKFAANFSAVFPVVDLKVQLTALQPDVVFVHRPKEEWLQVLAKADDIRRIAFVHDHDLLCLRKHKRALMEARPCSRRSGAACTLRCGPVARGPRRLELRTQASVARGQAALAALDEIIAPSSYMLNQLESVGVPRSKLHKLAPLVELPPLRDGTAVSPGSLLFVGALTTGKGALQLVEAMAFLDETVSLQVLGDGPQRAKIEDRARALGVSARVRFFGHVDRAIVMRELQRSQLFVSPAIAPESFGLGGVEALAAGVPVVGTRAGGVTEWLRHEETGLMVEPGDSQALAEAISQALCSPARMRRLARAGRQRALQLLDATVHTSRLAELLGLESEKITEVA
jgi:glycosyltransferase involved in cell wall biosynthesis